MWAVVSGVLSCSSEGARCWQVKEKRERERCSRRESGVWCMQEEK